MAKSLTKLDPKKTLFLLCDVQEGFRKAIPLFNNMVTNITKLLQVGRAFEVPLLVSEQYPKGLGNTVKELDVSNALHVINKTQFTMCLPETLSYIKEIPDKPEDLVLFGVETHVCVLQTSIDFLENDFKVHVVADCCASRLNQDRDLGLSLLRQIGCFIQPCESVIFSLLQDKQSPKFDTVKIPLKIPSADMELVRSPKKTSMSDLKKPATETVLPQPPEKKSLPSTDVKKSNEKSCSSRTQREQMVSPPGKKSSHSFDSKMSNETLSPSKTMLYAKPEPMKKGTNYVGSTRKMAESKPTQRKLYAKDPPIKAPIHKKFLK